MSLPQETLQMLADWRAVKAQLDQIKATELAMRNAIVERLKTPGGGRTQTFEIANGWKAKLVQATTYSFIKDGNKVNKAAVELALTQIEKESNDGAFITERLVSWKPELSVSEYKRLGPGVRSIIDRVLVSRDATPTLELIEPK